MVFLCLEGSTDEWSVALVENGKVLSELAFDQQSSMAAQLTPAIGHALSGAERKIADLNAIVISSGPGSYTGLRIIASTAKGLCLGSGLPLIAIPTLKSLAWKAIESQKYDCIISILDARRQDVFCCIYDGQGNEILEPSLITLTDECFDPYLNDKVVFCGNGQKKISSYKWASKVQSGASQCQASTLYGPARLSFEARNFENIASFSPFYLLPPNITQSKKV